MYGEGKLDSMGLNLDHWAWDVHPPRNGAFNPVEQVAPTQSLAGRSVSICLCGCLCGGLSVGKTDGQVDRQTDRTDR